MSSASKGNNSPDGQQLPSRPEDQVLQEFETLVAEMAQPTFRFRLYVAGTSLRSSQAVTNVRNICEKYLPGRYELEVVDVYQQPEETSRAQVIAIPTLIKEFPGPPRRFVGDMSSIDRILICLNLQR